uniref:Hepatocyte growth factor-regulated tyrosine kinase substrate n=1 Tax=Rhipicephalus zambeziensis TaxID=60191 RepID=A0A224YYL5_9ACAR
MFSWSTAAFDKLLDKATSHLLLEPDWPSIIQICDCIRQGDVQPKYAVSAIKKRLYTRNPHVTLFALQVLESCVKNCGALVHNEIATKPFMEELRDLVKANTNEAVRDKVLELVQAWAHAFRNDPNYRAVQDTLNLMKMEGYKFPYLKESDAMFSADQAPEWADGDCCHRCRVQFSLVQRKHHCRNCGQIFCQKCSSQNAPIPRFGIEKEVRVCEACFEKLSAASKALAAKAPQKGSGSEQSSPSQTSSAPAGGKSEQELQEEEELQLALALSKSEVETNQRSTRRSWQPPSTVSNSTTTNASSPPVSASDAGDKASDKMRRKDLADGDPELARYLNRAYWEQRQQQQQQQDTNSVDGLPSRQSPIPSAPTSAGSPFTVPPKNAEKVDIIGGEADSQLEEFVTQLRSTLEVFVNRLQSNAARGRPVANDSYVQSLFMSVTNMHSQLLHHLQQQEDLREYYEGLQDKLAQIRDARAALDALREEHREQLRREADEAERQRQIQMAQKLHIMRQKKQEYLQYQHQLALQRMQEQERELQMRHELQKQYHHGGAGFPNQQPGLPPQGMPPQGMPPQQPGPPVNMGAPPDHSHMHLPPQLRGGPMPPVGPAPGQMMPPPQGQPMPQGMPPPQGHPIPPHGQPHVMTTQGHTIMPPPGQHSLPPQGQAVPPQGHLSMQPLPAHSAPMSMPPQIPQQQQARPPMPMPALPPPYRSPTHVVPTTVPMQYMMGTAPHAAMMAQAQYGPVSMPAPMGLPMDFQAFSMQQAMSMGMPMMHGPMPHQDNPAASPPPQHHRPPSSNESATGASSVGAPPQVQEAALISFD